MRAFLLLLSLVLVTTSAFPHGVVADQTVTYEWKNMNTSTPGKLNHLTLSFDIAADKLIAASGRFQDQSNGTHATKTYAYDLTTNIWENRNPTVSYPAGQWAHMTYNSIEKTSILFGGGSVVGGLAVADMWSYDYLSNNWTQLASHPDGIIFPQFDFIPTQNALFVTGGDRPLNTYLHEDWMYFFGNDSWVQLHPNYRPITPHSSVNYNPSSDTILQFGTSGVHEYSFVENNWTLLPSSGDTRAIERSDIVYDSIHDNFIRFGGFDLNLEDDPNFDSTQIDETWIFDYQTRTWTLLDLPNRPQARDTDSNVEFNPNAGAVMLYGGGESLYFNDTWVLDITDIVETTDNMDSTDTSSDVSSSTSSPSSTETSETSDTAQTPYLLPIILMIVPVLVRKQREIQK